MQMKRKERDFDRSDKPIATRDAIIDDVKDIWKLSEPVQNLIQSLENLLDLTYPIRVPKYVLQSRKKPILATIAKILIGHFYLTCDERDKTDITVFKWLGITHDQIPSSETIALQLQQPHIVHALAIQGLATYPFPKFTLNTKSPSPKDLTFLDSVHHFGGEGDEKASFLITAPDILQAHISIRLQLSMVTGGTSYELDFNFGRKHSLSAVANASRPYNESLDLIVLLYNARGADMSGFRIHLQNIVQTFIPMIIIITESRQGSAEGKECALSLHYDQVICCKPVESKGGIWIMSNLKHVSIQQLMNTTKEIQFNLLQV